MDHEEGSLFIAPGTVRSSEDLEDDTGDYKVPSRYSTKTPFALEMEPESRCLSHSICSFRCWGVSGVGLDKG